MKDTMLNFAAWSLGHLLGYIMGIMYMICLFTQWVWIGGKRGYIKK